MFFFAYFVLFPLYRGGYLQFLFLQVFMSSLLLRFHCFHLVIVYTTIIIYLLFVPYCTIFQLGFVCSVLLLFSTLTQILLTNAALVKVAVAVTSCHKFHLNRQCKCYQYDPHYCWFLHPALVSSGLSGPSPQKTFLPYQPDPQKPNLSKQTGTITLLPHLKVPRGRFLYST